jgi:hypothetical protein
LGDDYRTYPEALFRDKEDDLGAGFTVRDGNYLSARWPGDAHRFANDVLLMLGKT